LIVVPRLGVPFNPNKTLEMLDIPCRPSFDTLRTGLDPNPLPLYITPNILLIGNGLVVAQLG
jgi:hypothetical protein